MKLEALGSLVLLCVCGFVYMFVYLRVAWRYDISIKLSEMLKIVGVLLLFFFTSYRFLGFSLLTNHLETPSPVASTWYQEHKHSATHSRFSGLCRFSLAASTGLYPNWYRTEVQWSFPHCILLKHFSLA